MAEPIEANKPHDIINDAQTKSYDFSYLKGIDLQDALKRVVHNEKLFVSLLEKFREKYSNSIDDIKKLVEQNKLVEAESECHKLKGISGSMGANELFEILQQMDTELLSLNPPTKKQIELSQTMLEDIMDSIGKFLEHIAKKEIEVDSIKKSPMQLKKALQEVLNYLDSDIGIAIDKFDYFYENFSNQIDEKELENIKGALYEFDIESVKKHSAVIMKSPDFSPSHH